MNKSYKAMLFAISKHRGQVRRYTGDPYHVHLAQVAGIVATKGFGDSVIASAWLHDVIEDCGVSVDELRNRFGESVSMNVLLLSDIGSGNRAQRKLAQRNRLASAPADVQTIKCADIISNAESIIRNDTKFAVTYVSECRELLSVMREADIDIRALAFEILGGQ